MSEQSNEKWRASRIQISVRGIITEDFIAWFLPRPDEKEVDPEKLAAHPEHWVLTVFKRIFIFKEPVMIKMQ